VAHATAKILPDAGRVRTIQDLTHKTLCIQT
jgi:hypothetical protein